MNIQKTLFNLKSEANGDNALKLLHIASYFAPNKININLFSDLLGDTKSLNNAVELMIVCSLLQYAEEKSCIIIDSAVRGEVQKISRLKGEEEFVLNVAIELLYEPFIKNRFGILDHAMSLFNAAKAYPELLKKTSKFPNFIINRLLQLDRYSEAQAFGREALEVLKRSIGAYHESTCRLQKQLGMSLLFTKRVQEGTDMLSEAYVKSSESTGRVSIDQTLKVVARTAAYSMSEPESWVRQLVFGNVSVSDTNNNSDLHHWCEYAMMLLDLNWKDEALSILNQVLGKRLVLLRPDDDSILQVMEQIAKVHMQRREYRQALEVYREIYDKRKLSLGENSIKTHLTGRDVANAFEALGILEEALVVYEAVAEGIRRIFGDENITFLSIRSKMAYVMFRQNKYESAFTIYSQLYSHFVRLLKETGNEPLSIKYNVEHLLSQNKQDGASSIWDDPVFPEDIQVFGTTDSDIADIIRHMCILKLYRKILGY